MSEQSQRLCPSCKKTRYIPKLERLCTACRGINYTDPARKALSLNGLNDEGFRAVMKEWGVPV